MGRDYSDSTIKRYEALRERGINCNVGNRFCLNKAKFAAYVEGKKDDGSYIFQQYRACKKHYRELEELKNVDFGGKVEINIRIFYS